MEFGPILRAAIHHRARTVLIIAEVALTLAIVTNCLSLIRNLKSSMTHESGFDEDNILSVVSEPFAAAFKEDAYQIASIDDDVRRLGAMAGVRAASTTNFLPWRGGGNSGEVKIAGGPDTKFRAQQYVADPHLFDTLGVHVIRGRTFTAQEYESSASPNNTALSIVVTKARADRLFPGQEALGKRLEDPDHTQVYTIVGIIDKFYNPFAWSIDEHAYFFPGRSYSYLVRAEPGKAEALVPVIERALLRANDGRNVRVKTIREVRFDYNYGFQLAVTPLNLMMILLVVVTALGIVGITSFSVAERRRQIGTRRALGATREAILRHFLLENWLVTTAGVLLGLGLAVALNVGLVTLVEGAKIEWPILATGVALLWTVGLLATLGPALRASQVPPAIATRNV
jgi:putative ABC transport system permease protein